MNKAYSRINWENYPSTNTALNESNLNAMDAALNEIDSRVVNMDTTKAETSELLTALSGWEINETTGVVKLTFKNGSTQNINTNIGKIATNFTYDAQNERLVLTMPDGKTTYVDMSALITQYEFKNSTEVNFNVDQDGKVTANIIDGSITANKLQPNFLADVQSAEASANASKLESEGWAVGKQNGQDVGTDSPYYHNNAKYWSDKAGGTSLSGLSDTDIINPTNEDVLTYDNGLWKNKPNAKADGIEYDADSSVLYLKNGNRVLDFTTIDSGVASVIHVQTHEQTWWGNPNVTIEIYDSEEDITGGHFDENGDYFHKIHFLGTYTVVVTDENGVEYRTTFEDTQIGQVYYVFVDMWGYRGWLKSINLSDAPYSSLADVLADETTVRTLMTKHASVDYLFSWCSADSNLITTLLANTNVCKWLGLRDYAYDKFYAEYGTQMLGSDNWEYFLKDKVPIMTSDSLPYGEAFSSGYNSGYLPYFAFNGDSTGQGFEPNTSAEKYFGYKFVNPICVKYAWLYNNSNANITSAKIQGSNDGTTWTDLKTNIACDSKAFAYIHIDNDNYYLQYRLYDSTLTSSGSGYSMNYYGRALNVSVPTMTSDSAPYGEVIASGMYGSENAPFQAFDKNLSKVWMNNNSSSCYIGYKFPSNVLIKQIVMQLPSSATSAPNYIPKEFDLEVSDDGTTWRTIQHFVNLNQGNSAINVHNVTEVANAKYIRLNNIVANNSAYVQIAELQFYGLDYTERENRTYIYDNGLEILPITYASGMSNTDNVLTCASGTYGTAHSPLIDTTPFHTVRAILGEKLTTDSNNPYLAVSTTTSGSATASKITPNSDIPYNMNLDITNVNGNYYVRFANNSKLFTSKEWWLE